MRALVTGGAGFIGSHLMDRLLALGHEVTVLDDLSRGRREQVDARARLVVQDVADPAVCDLVAAERFEVVFHLAAQMDVRRSMLDPVYDARVNVLGSLHLLEGARRGGTRAFVFASTGGAVYGENQPIPARETDPTEPVSIYGASKLAVEKYLGVYRAGYGLDYAVLRLANVYGPRQDPHGEAGVVAIFCERLLAGRRCVVNGDGRQTRDYVYVADVVEAFVGAMQLRGAHVFNVGTGVETDVLAIHETLRRLAGSSEPPEHAPAKAGEQRRSAVDAALAGQVLAWRPRVDLEEGLAATWAWFGARAGRGPRGPGSV
jgi:UDP-glucose 4-epimerase